MSNTRLHQQTERSYSIRKPILLRHKDQPKVPVIIVLHGGGGNGASVEKITGFTEKATRRGFAVVYPNGTGRIKWLRRGKVWNAKHCCGYAMENRVDDVSFIAQLIDELIKSERADPQRIYIAGMSNGGAMTHRLATELSHKISAIASVVGFMFGDEPSPTNAVPALIINGNRDTVIPPDGGVPAQRLQKSFDGMRLKPSAYQAEFWANVNQCDTPPEIADTTDSNVKTYYYYCPNAVEVIYHLVKDGTHSWPGGKKGWRGADTPSKSLDATTAIIDFFTRHPVGLEF